MRQSANRRPLARVGQRYRKPSKFHASYGQVITAELIDLWIAMLKKCRRSEATSLHLTDKQFLIAVETIRCVLLCRRETPNRAWIASRVRRTTACSEKSVERAHIRLAGLGLLRWDMQYEIGNRVTEICRIRQARRVCNLYEFILPGAPIPVPPPKLRNHKERPHSCDRHPVGVPLNPSDNSPSQRPISRVPQSPVVTLKDRALRISGPPIPAPFPISRQQREQAHSCERQAVGVPLNSLNNLLSQPQSGRAQPLPVVTLEERRRQYAESQIAERKRRSPWRLDNV